MITLHEELSILRESHPEFFATDEQIESARGEHASEDIEIDDNAFVSEPEDGYGYWVSAWVWVRK